MTGNTFKERFNNHNKSFSKIEYKNSTGVSKYVWDLKERECEFSMKDNAVFNIHPETGSLLFQWWKELQPMLAEESLHVERRQGKLVKQKM